MATIFVAKRRAWIVGFFFSLTQIVVAQTDYGIAAGWVVADQTNVIGDILASEHFTATSTGAGAFSAPITQTSPAGAAWSQTEFPDTRVIVDSGSLPIGKVAYAGSYFVDEVTFTGGVGTFPVNVSWELEGSIGGSGGKKSIGGAPLLNTNSGDAAVNFRVFLEGLGATPPALSDSELFKTLAVDQPNQSLSDFRVPEFDPTWPFQVYNGPSDSVFIFNGYDDMDNVIGVATGILTDENISESQSNFIGVQFNWEYGVPMDMGVLLEGWTKNGGAVDFSNTGSFASFEVPAGTMVSSAVGASYTLTNTFGCDFDDDGECAPGDLDELYANFGTTGTVYDVDGSGDVDEDDILVWLAEASLPANPFNSNSVTFRAGDVNFDGAVDSTDLGVLLNNFGDNNGLLYGAGNLNGDPNVNSTDLGVLLNNFGMASTTTNMVPEPMGWAFLVLIFPLFRLCRASRVQQRTPRQSSRLGASLGP